jgi:hypothetical protein
MATCKQRTCLKLGSGDRSRFGPRSLCAFCAVRLGNYRLLHKLVVDANDPGILLTWQRSGENQMRRTRLWLKSDHSTVSFPWSLLCMAQCRLMLVVWSMGQGRSGNHGVCFSCWMARWLDIPWPEAKTTMAEGNRVNVRNGNGSTLLTTANWCRPRPNA